MTKFFVILGTTVLLAGFQNCAKTSFSSANGDGGSMQSLSGDGTKGGTGTGTNPTPTETPPTNTGGEATGNLNQNGDVCTSAPGTNVIVPTQKHMSCANMHGSSSPMVDECDTDPNGLYVACILEGPGKSVKLGLVNGALAGVNGVSSSVCVTKAECLGDVAKAFGVEGAYDRGYCDHNPNVQRLTDAQVKQLLGVK